MSLHSGAATLPKGFCQRAMSGPRTPEPGAPTDEAELPPPPRPRLRLKRRHVSQLHAPTQQFLASVAAADVPMPSVEDPEIENKDHEMMDPLPELQVDDFEGDDIYQYLRPRPFSPPRTPAPETAPLSSPTKYPDWSIDSDWSESDLESSPECGSSRPSTAFSTQTSSSLFSQYSHHSEDEDCLSPDVETTDLAKSEEDDATRPSEKPRKAPWTKAMSSHLWATYLLYLSDPRVTPIRQGKSCIPPNGVCARVARQAQRSWKGSKAPAATQPRSGSSTPTADCPKTFMQWPHTPAATRAHLRELCRLKATSKPGRYISQSPTPFNKAAHRRWNRRSTPARSPSVFSSQGMAMSLTLSTSDSMQPHGPLAQLTRSESEAEVFPDLTPGVDMVKDTAPTPRTPDRNRAGPLLLAKSYGPSSSSTLGAGIDLPRQSNTMGPRKLLKSPVRLTRSRSGTQKRRSVKGLEEAPRKRPSLSAAFWRERPRAGEATTQAQGLEPEQMDKILSGRAILAEQPLLAASMPADSQTQGTTPFVLSDTSSLAPPARPARLGSPFSGGGSSHSFPNRLSSPVNFNLTALRRPFATVQQTSQASVDTPSPVRSTLASRLAYLDQRLRELRNRGSDRRRSESPL
ncbi:hypothetical protein GGR56DRAFT_615521 [Xylariaceae sp. FL0804]|nr:hypothetical protein GGR56DRAFT_615521 [Xylariaceae sp. FL0804]